MPFDASTSGSEDNCQPSEHGCDDISLLKLSRKIISVTFTIPYIVRAPRGRGDWEIKLSTRHEHSVQFDALTHLSSRRGPWDHTIVGWTGEVATSDSPDGYGDIHSVRSARDIPPPPGNKTFIHYDSKRTLERQLHNAELKTVPTDAYWIERGWAGYCFMIESFADKICDMYQPGDIVMVHDYHLMMLPHILRRRLPDIYLVFLLHTACPTYEFAGGGLAPLSKILRGAVGSDLIVFQAPKYFAEFASWCAKDFQDRNVRRETRLVEACVVSPMGIDQSRVASIAWSEAVGKKCESLRGSFPGKKIIVSYGTPDGKGGMDEVVMGVDLLLTWTPRWKDKVVLLQIICSSGAESAYGESFVSLVSELMEQTNERHDSRGFGHVKRYRGRVSEIEYYSLLRASDAAIFPFAPGGMTTAGLEYAICQQGSSRRPIISDASPIAHQLPDAITYCPGDIHSIARAINHALVLSDWPLMGKPHCEEFGCAIVNTAERWMNCVLRSLVGNLLKRQPLGAPPDHNGPRGSRPHEDYIEAAVEWAEHRHDGVEGDAGQGSEEEGHGGHDDGSDGGAEGEEDESEEDTETEDTDEEARVLMTGSERIERETGDRDEERAMPRAVTV
ncbi:hypothetical protein Trco_007798 [Trichoderma cornu-damae]|uniref:Glycosyltransferase family 20 protein n=1 Tax=Trichoderma cornu-damae TaxID=654480 RepID=A0A9P8QKQ8_9HYPO|nr:hypothetical protein Trco_007798 [Trichoderma cornu-damae]